MSYCKGIKEDLRLECWFEARLRDEFAKSSLGNSWEPVFGDIKSWRKLYSQIVTILREKDSQIATIFFPTDSVQPIQQHEKRINASFMLDTERASSKFSEELLERIKAARRNLISNKTHERKREREGEMVMATFRRIKQGPPAHVLTRMSEKEKRKDRIMREVGAGGYSKWVKTGVWDIADEGREENREMLDSLERELREYNLQKRVQAKY